MQYELAKQLKDAGYPQDKKSGIYLHKSGRLNLGKIKIKDFSEVSEGMVYLPLLSELIEACGDGFGGLTKEEKGWVAHKEFITTDSGLSYVPPFGTGETSEEALANLWLALNEKNT